MAQTRRAQKNDVKVKTTVKGTADAPMTEEEMIADVQADDTENDTASTGAVVVTPRRKRMISTPESEIAEYDEPKGRPTPSASGARVIEPARQTGIAGVFEPIRAYFQDVFAELGRVAWPTREEAIRLTYIVIIVTAIVALFLGGVSYLFSLLTTAVANDNTSTIFGIVSIVVVIVVAGGWLMRDRLFGRYD